MSIFALLFFGNDHHFSSSSKRYHPNYGCIFGRFLGTSRVRSCFKMYGADGRALGRKCERSLKA